ncbi:hypothetical protein ACLOJK_017490 [Asimina triloba]
MSECKEPSGQAFKLGLAAAGLLALAHVIANLLGGCICICSKEEFVNLHDQNQPVSRNVTYNPCKRDFAHDRSGDESVYLCGLTLFFYKRAAFKLESKHKADRPMKAKIPNNGSEIFGYKEKLTAVENTYKTHVNTLQRIDNGVTKSRRGQGREERMSLPVNGRSE